ncbi:MAG: DUF3179 domain-containing protein [Caldilineae bacterium]|nr:MAG: DUF3179 domain-containing protein [Caldilineae bacterium]
MPRQPHSYSETIMQTSRRSPLLALVGVLAGLAVLVILVLVLRARPEPARTAGTGPGAIASQKEPTPLPTARPTDTPQASVARQTKFDIESDIEIMTEDNRSQRLRSLTATWNTDWTRHTIRYDEILSGGPPRDGIPSIDEPKFISQEEAATWLADAEPVVALEIDGDARAYPLQILTWHEIVNDVVGGIPVAVTFCPLCNSAITFDRRFQGEVLEFGTSGLLRNSDLIMYDRTTESLWQQFTGEGIVGELAGARLTFIPSSLIGFGDFRVAYPDGVVLSRDTGFSRSYGRNPYAGYDNIGQNPFLFDGIPDERLPAMARVVTVDLGDVAVAYPLTILAEKGVIHDTPGGHDLVVFHVPGTVSALDASTIINSRDVGATGVFDPNLDGQKLTFKQQDKVFVDDQTGSTWNIVGQAIDGPLAGKQLTPILHADHFWFSWAAFKPETIIYGSS